MSILFLTESNRTDDRYDSNDRSSAKAYDRSATVFNGRLGNKIVSRALLIVFSGGLTILNRRSNLCLFRSSLLAGRLRLGNIAKSLNLAHKVSLSVLLACKERNKANVKRVSTGSSDINVLRIKTNAVDSTRIIRKLRNVNREG